MPYPPSPRIRELVDSWRAQSTAPAELVSHALDFFRAGSFSYTLKPPLLKGDPVDGFLFGTRQGFCEHFAAAFTVLMRVAGVPTRVVTGYQGGRWNAIGQFLEVRQADAHAWAEVWLPETGWMRVDPTAAVAPQRIERGMELASQADTSNVNINPLDVKAQQTETDTHAKSFGTEADNAWDSLNHAWNLWILTYTPEVQTGLLIKLGFVSWRAISGGLVVLIAAMLAVTALLILPKGGQRMDRTQTLYARLLKKMARRGFVKQPTEGAQTFLLRVGPLVPESEQAIQRITEVFLNIRYGRESGPEDIETLKRLVKAFRI